jgi:hypothetical protein
MYWVTLHSPRFHLFYSKLSFLFAFCSCSALTWGKWKCRKMYCNTRVFLVKVLSIENLMTLWNSKRKIHRSSGSRNTGWNTHFTSGYETVNYEGVSKSFRTGHLERELHMVQLSATRCSCITILWVSIVNLDVITLCVASQRVFIVVYFVIDSVRKLLDIPSYSEWKADENDDILRLPWKLTN